MLTNTSTALALRKTVQPVKWMEEESGRRVGNRTALLLPTTPTIKITLQKDIIQHWNGQWPLNGKCVNLNDVPAYSFKPPECLHIHLIIMILSAKWNQIFGQTIHNLEFRMFAVIVVVALCGKLLQWTSFLIETVNLLQRKNRSYDRADSYDWMEVMPWKSPESIVIGIWTQQT